MFQYPIYVAVDDDGYVYVTDASNCRVQKFTPAGGFLATWGTPGWSGGQFRGPTGIAVDGTGNIFVADQPVHRVQVFDPNGGFLAAWGTPGTRDGQFNNPEGIAIDGDGNVYVADTGNQRIQKFAPVVAVPGGAVAPIDTDADDLYDDVNGNGRKDFADVVLYFNSMTWIAENEPVSAFDYNGNGRIDFADVVWLFTALG